MEKKARLEQLATTMKPNHLFMAQSLAEGNTQEQAYRDSGGKGKDGKSLGNQMILTNPHISEYAYLSKSIAAQESQDKLVGTVAQKRKLLWDIATLSAKARIDDSGVAVTTDSRAAISAVTELNKMDGDLAAIKNDNNNAYKFETLTDQQLQRIIDG